MTSTPLGTGKPAGRGPGVPSATYSTGVLTPSHTAGLISELRWSASVRDECGYDYTGAAQEVVSLSATSFVTNYIGAAAAQLPAAELPVVAFGAGPDHSIIIFPSSTSSRVSLKPLALSHLRRQRCSS